METKKALHCWEDIWEGEEVKPIVSKEPKESVCDLLDIIEKGLVNCLNYNLFENNDTPDFWQPVKPIEYVVLTFKYDNAGNAEFIDNTSRGVWFDPKLPKRIEKL
jgi:hypothetical protein